MPFTHVIAGSSPAEVTNMGGYTVDSSGADCKSAVIDSGGATPSPPTII